MFVLLWIAVIVVVLAVLSYVAIVAIVARRVIFPRRSRPTRIVTASRDQIVVEETPMTKQTGPLGVLFDDERRHAVLGDVLSVEPGLLTRKLVTVNDAIPASDSLSRPIGNVFASPEVVDAEVREVSVETPLGAAPAWVFPGDSSVWAVHIHGMLSGRDAALRSVSSLRANGYTQLVPSFRGDGEGPAAPNGSSALGQSEWLDVESALEYAVESGAQQIILVGWSIGATIALILSTNSVHRDRLAGLILISPVIDWRHSIAVSGARAGIPRFVVTSAIWALRRPVWSRVLGAADPIDFDALDWRSKQISFPTLIIHSPDDQTAPFEDTESVRDRNIRLVSVEVFAGALHALEWNSDPARFAAVARSWCQALA